MTKQPEELRQEADEYLEHMKIYASHWGKALAVAGGTFFLTYKIIKVVIAQKKKQRRKKAILQEQQYALASTKPTSRIGRLIKEQIALFLIGIAKQRLAEALRTRKA